MLNNPYESPSKSDDTPSSTPKKSLNSYGILSVVASAFAIGIPIPVMIGFADLPPGTAMRPMLEAAAAFASAAIGLCMALPLAIAAVFNGRRSLGGRAWLFAVILAAIAVVLHPMVLNYIIKSRGYVLLE